MKAEVVVVGAGVDGLATARALAREGRDVLVLEQFPAGHKRGSSHGRSRIFRLAYPDEEWVRLAQESFDGWRELEAESGEEVLGLPGLIELVDDLKESSYKALTACGVETEVLDPNELVRRFSLRVADGWLGMLQPQAGFVLADRALAALRASAENRGARVVFDSPVESLEELDAGAIVVTAGAWARRLLAASGIELPVVETRETVAYFHVERETPTPSVVTMIHHGHGLYSVFDPVHGLKVGHHHSGPKADPDEEGAPDPAIVDEVTSWAGRTFSLAEPDPVGAETCFYTNTDDERFILERHGRIVVGSACSGHGFKFAPAVGKRLAALAAEALA
ncbi:MAG: FAD-dependent oxidoreductase [Gaiellaceae bacterium]